MKKFTTLLAIILVLLFLSTNVYAVNPHGQKQIQGQGQVQGQMQGQAQGQISVNKNTNKNNATNANDQIMSYNEAAQPRTYHTGGNIEFAPLGNYTGKYLKGAEFTPMAVLTRIRDTFSYELALKFYGKQWGKGKCTTIGGSYSGRHESDPSKYIKVLTKVDPSAVTVVGFLTVKARKKNVDSFVVLQKAVLSACLMQADAILVTGEGASTIAKTSGSGIGFNTSGGMINDMDNRGRSAVASGGTGWSWGTAYLLTKPWITVQVLKFK